MTKIDELKKYQEKINDLEYVLNILAWDLKTKAPKESIQYAIDTKAKMSMELFRISTSKEYETLINDALLSEEYSNLDEVEKRYIGFLKKNIDRNNLIPEKFYEEYTILKDEANHVWEQAKEENNYDLFKPYLKQLVDKTSKLYEYISPNLNAYDAMLDDYETGMTTKEIDVLFDDIKEGLKPLVDKSLKSEYSESLVTGKYSDSKLIEAANYLLDYIGFDLGRGALGVYPHGFTEKMNNYDVRIAFKNTTSVTDFVGTIIHEGGHGIFEQNIDRKIYPYTNHCAEYCYGLHESQSRFYENILGRNINFWIPIYSDIKRIFDLNVDIDTFVSELNKVKPSLIRTQADELTYCFHIIIRYEIERDLFNGKIDIDDLPKIWDEKMMQYLGIKPENISDGLLQDVHWSQGSFGYFPSYLIGNIIDGMLKEQMEKELGSIDKILESGNIKMITSWLNNKIHIYGGAYSGIEVIKRVCHQDITSKPILKYFIEKYREI